MNNKTKQQQIREEIIKAMQDNPVEEYEARLNGGYPITKVDKIMAIFAREQEPLLRLLETYSNPVYSGQTKDIIKILDDLTKQIKEEK